MSAPAPALPDFVQDLGHGIYAIDTAFQRDHFDAAFLIVEQGRAAFIDTGTNFAVPRHLQALSALGIALEAVDWVIPTHVHLDHAGGVGRLMQHLPKAQVLVHPRGARHLVDPRALYEGALAVYGAEEMARSYGELVAVDADRVLSSHDNMMISLAGRSLVLIDTPGHARHHHAVWDARSLGWFTGDTFGLSYREFDTTAGAYVLPTTSPVQFEPEPLRQSIARMLATQPDCLYLTHFGRVTDAPRLATQLLAQVDDMLDAGLPLAPSPARHQALKDAFSEIYLKHIQAHGVSLPREKILDLLSIDIELNAQGFGVWLDRQAPRPAA